MSVEKLSLSTFEPSRATEPFLNSPRSLEACRLHGVNPIELVEIPLEEFRKDCPDDPDTAQRRFEKIDGARRRILREVVQEYHALVASDWQPGVRKKNTISKNESIECIIDVDKEAHTTLLDLQAQKFRKFEMQQWKDLQRLVATEIRMAVQEAQNRNIMDKHQDLNIANERLKKVCFIYIFYIFEETKFFI